VIGQQFKQCVDGVELDLIPLPHPSGASTWHRMPPGNALLDDALNLLAEHASWKKLR